MNNSEIEKIYKKYYKNLILYAVSLTGNLNDAEALVQSTFLKQFYPIKILEASNFGYQRC
ncbi:hypothetical protein [Peptostreptococcus sp. D1]|uniref:hypothetical protein n=1 Tax=Peptostreptococcus sp. D1 TaxID=72304 RepID=UPI0008E9ECF8|nr:hypothetical protein [Peptostreptococcus sp. D1]SFE32278.1 hypothetical protein SAMN02910278_00530 [Peptostreptococcus sp. D1]